MSHEVLAYYENTSSFHGDGTAFWLSTEGAIVGYRFVKGEEETVKRDSFSFKLTKNQVEEFRTRFSTLDGNNINFTERDGYPDEVRVKLGFRESSGHFREFSLWDGDQGKQEPVALKLIDIIMDISLLIFNREPQESENLSLNAVLPFQLWPEDFEKPLAHSS